TKAGIVGRARAVFGSAACERFLGGHPMAGKEHSGIEHSDPDLFQDAAWLLTPVEGQSLLAGASGAFVELLETIGARILTFSPETPDRLCAWISHIPQLLATALAASLAEEFGEDPNGHNGAQDLRAIDGRALREMTRISASPYSMWRDITLTNSTNIEDA